MNKKKTNAPDIRAIVSEAIKKVVNENAMDEYSCDCLPRELKHTFFSRVINATHGNIGDVEKVVTEFYNQFKGRVSAKTFKLDALMKLANDIQEHERDNSAIIPGAESAGNLGIEDYDAHGMYRQFESKNSGKVKLTESELKKVVAESVKKVLKEREYNRNDGWFLYTEINNDGAEVLSIRNNRGDFDYWRKNGGNSYGQYPSYEEAAKAMVHFATKEGFRRKNGCFVKLS